MTRRTPLLLLTATVALAAPAGASAAVAHTVTAGESLWQLAAAQNMTTRAFAAANGLPEDARVVAGSTIQLPSTGEATVALAEFAAASSPATAQLSAPAAATGGHSVQPGETMSGLAAASGMTLARFAALNGLDPARPLLAGSVVKSSGAPAATTSAAPSAPAPSTSQAPGRVSAEQVSSIAAAHGVPGSLAAAIGWQESGFNNAMVSSTDARGVMQVMPGTWDDVQSNLSARRLDRSSPDDNVTAGVLYLGSLLRSSGGDPRLAAAGYYQGPASVARIGLLPETRRYVDNVMALRARFGG